MNDEVEMFDAEANGVLIEGLAADQIRRLKRYYQFRTGDMDLDMLEEATKNL